MSEKEREIEIRKSLRELKPTAEDLIQYLETMKNPKWFEDFIDWLLGQRIYQTMRKLEQLKKRKR